MPEPAEGQVPAGDFDVVPDNDAKLASEEQQKEKREMKKEIDIVAREVLAGHWGRGRQRQKRLEDAGYDVSEINAEITKILNQW